MDAQMATEPMTAHKVKTGRASKVTRNGQNLNFQLDREAREQLDLRRDASISSLIERMVREELSTDELPDDLVITRPRVGTPRTCAQISPEAYDRLQSVSDNTGISMAGVVSALISKYIQKTDPIRPPAHKPLVFIAA